MALLFCDGFDHYNTAAMGARKWNTFTPSVFTTGRFGRGTYVTCAAANSIIKTLAASSATLIAGFAMQVPSFAYSGDGNFQFKDAGTTQVSLRVDSDGRIGIYRNGVTLLGSSSISLRTNTWYYVELKVTINNTTGTVDLVVNGANVLSLTGQNTRQTANNSANQVSLSSSGVNSTLYDDFYVCDTTGSVNNTFLNEIEIRTTFPTGDSAVQFTRSTGATNALNVDETQPNDDTDYNEDSVVGHKDVFTLTADSPAVTTVKSVALTTTMRNTDASARSGRANLKSSATTANGATIALSTSYVMNQDVFDTDPNGAIAWTPTNKNSALPGYEVVS